jgi:hypothetical protein
VSRLTATVPPGGRRRTSNPGWPRGPPPVGASRRDLPAGCARRSPERSPGDGGSIPPTSTKSPSTGMNLAARPTPLVTSLHHASRLDMLVSWVHNPRGEGLPPSFWGEEDAKGSRYRVAPKRCCGPSSGDERRTPSVSGFRWVGCHHRRCRRRLGSRRCDRAVRPSVGRSGIHVNWWDPPVGRLPRRVETAVLAAKDR